MAVAMRVECRVNNWIKEQMIWIVFHRNGMGQDPNQRGSFFSIATKVSLNLQEYWSDLVMFRYRMLSQSFLAYFTMSLSNQKSKPQGSCWMYCIPWCTFCITKLDNYFKENHFKTLFNWQLQEKMLLGSNNDWLVSNFLDIYFVDVIAGT